MPVQAVGVPDTIAVGVNCIIDGGVVAIITGASDIGGESRAVVLGY